MELPARPNWLPKILEEESFLHWHAFIKQILYNHKAHSLVALARIGASEERVKQNCDHNNKAGFIIPFADEPTLTQRSEVDSLESDNIDDYLGKSVGFYKILDHFTKLYETKYGKDIKKFLQAELPRLIDGPLGSLFHGIIQVGYGYAAGSDQVVLEGIALSFHGLTVVKSSTDPSKARDVSKFGKGTIDILDILPEIKEKKEKDVTNNPESWKNAGAICENFGDTFLDAVDRIKLPEWFDPTREDMNQVVRLMDWALDISAVVFVQSDYPNDFFFLHGITGAWSLLQVLDLVDHRSALLAVRAHLLGLLIVYARINPPGMTKRPEDYWKGEVVDQAAWDEILHKSVEKDYEAHIHKVVQCLYEAWKKNPTSPYAKYHIAGAKLALDIVKYHFPGK